MWLTPFFRWLLPRGQADQFEALSGWSSPEMHRQVLFTHAHLCQYLLFFCLFFFLKKDKIELLLMKKLCFLPCMHFVGKKWLLFMMMLAASHLLYNTMKMDKDDSVCFLFFYMRPEDSHLGGASFWNIYPKKNKTLPLALLPPNALALTSRWASLSHTHSFLKMKINHWISKVKHSRTVKSPNQPIEGYNFKMWGIS